MITTLHYDGHEIELPEGFDVERLVNDIKSADGRAWIPVSDKHHHQHRLFVSDGVGVRVTTRHAPAPPAPVGIPSTGPSIRDMQF